MALQNRLKKYMQPNNETNVTQKWNNPYTSTELPSLTDFDKYDEMTKDSLDEAEEYTIVYKAEESSRKISLRSVFLMVGEKVTITVKKEKINTITKNETQDKEKDILIDLTRNIIELENQLEIETQRSMSLQQENEIIHELLLRSQFESKQIVREIEMRNYSLFLYAVFSVLSTIFFISSLSLYLIWRFSGFSYFDPTNLFFATLAGFGWWATAITGLIWSRHRGKLK